MKSLSELYIRFWAIIFFIAAYMCRDIIMPDVVSKILKVVYLFGIGVIGSMFVVNSLVAFKKWWKE